MSKNEELILNAATSAEDRKTLACAEAFRLSREHGIPPKEVGETCNRLGIKIVDCELGCFK
jgi:alanyl-tRNA synthetase